MEIAPGIMQYDFPEKIANEIVKQAKDMQDWKRSDVSSDNKNLRTSDEIGFFGSISRGVGFATYKNIEKYLNDYVQFYKVSGVRVNGNIIILKYKVGDWFGSHYDSSWKIYRVVSMLIYLNPQEYEGGETYFEHFNIGVKPEKPSILFFPSNFMYRHQAQPVTNGEKLVLVGWMKDVKD